MLQQQQQQHQQHERQQQPEELDGTSSSSLSSFYEDMRDLPEHRHLLHVSSHRHHYFPSSYSAREEQQQQQINQSRQVLSSIDRLMIWKFGFIAMCSISAVAVVIVAFHQSTSTLRERFVVDYDESSSSAATAASAAASFDSSFSSSTRRHTHQCAEDALYDRWESWKDRDLGKLLQQKREKEDEPVVLGTTTSTSMRIPFTTQPAAVATTMTQQQDRDKAAVISKAYDDDVWTSIIKDGSATGAGTGGGDHSEEEVGEEDDVDSLSEQLREFGQKVVSWWKPTVSTIKSKIQDMEDNFSGWWDDLNKNNAAILSDEERATIKSKLQALQEQCADWWEERTGHSKIHDWWNNVNKTVLSDEERATIQSEIRALQEKCKRAFWWDDSVKDRNHTIQSEIQDKECVIKSKIQVLEDNFDAWWNKASIKERQWWDDTVASFGRFVSDSSSRSTNTNNNDKHSRWWDLVMGSTGGGSWESSSVVLKGEKDVEEWWEASRVWFSSHVVTTTTTARREQQQRGGTADRDLLYFNTTKAFNMLGLFDHSGHIFYYQQGWDVQINQAYCGVASTAAVLNSFKGTLLSDLPIDPVYNPYPYATQFSLVLNECVYQKVVHVDDTFNGILTFPGGLNLEQAGRLLHCHLPSSSSSSSSSSWNVSVVNVSPSVSMKDVTLDLIRALHDPRSRVVVNVHREGLGQDGGGHFSVLAGYNSQERMFLFMDVAKYKYPPAWVPAEKLYATMQTVDRCGSYRFPTRQWQDATLANVTQAAYHANASNEEMESLLALALQTLGCRPQYRGYIIVRQL